MASKLKRKNINKKNNRGLKSKKKSSRSLKNKKSVLKKKLINIRTKKNIKSKIKKNKKKNPSKKLKDNRVNKFLDLLKEKYSKLKNNFNLQRTLKKENHKLTKEMWIIIFFIIVLLIFNLSLALSKIITYECYNSIEFLSLVFLNPFLLVICGTMYGNKFGFSWMVPIILSLCFLPAVIAYLKIEFIFYVPIYFIFVLSSEIFGLSINKIKRIY